MVALDLPRRYRWYVICHSIRRILYMGWSGLLGAALLHNAQLRMGGKHAVCASAKTRRIISLSKWLASGVYSGVMSRRAKARIPTQESMTASTINQLNVFQSGHWFKLKFV